MKVRPVFLKTASVLWKHKKDAATLIFLDALFFISVWYSSRLVGLIVQQNASAVQSFSRSYLSALGFMTVFTLVYAVMIIALYSAFKLFVLKTIGKMIGNKKELLYTRLFFLNCMIYGSFIGAYVVLVSFVQWAVRFENQGYARNLIALAFVIGLYLAVAVSNGFFIQGLRLSLIGKRTMQFLLRPGRYVGVIAWSGAVVGVFYVVYYGTALVIAAAALPFYEGYVRGFMWVVIGMLYLLLIWFNRVYVILIEQP